MTEILEGYETVANCTLVCQDGIILSHKIVIASVSNILKSIISEIPVGDEVSIYFPDVETQFLKNQLQTSLLKKTLYFDDYLCRGTNQELTST